MKTIVISGIPRSGKSLLAKTIYDSTKCSIFHLDMLCSCARKAFSIPFSRHDDPDNIFGLMNDFQEFLVRVVKNVGQEFEHIRVFESTFLEPKEVAEKFIGSEYICLYMGYPNIERNEKLSQLRSYGSIHPQCWTNNESDSKLLDHLSHFIEVSKMQEVECGKYNIPYYDCSVDFEKVFFEAKSFVSSQLNKSGKSWRE